MKKLLLLLFSVIGMTQLTAYADEPACPPHTAANVTALKQAVKWYTDSAEIKALYRQGYAIALAYVENQVKQAHLKPHQWGVILDIDETALNNGWYYRQCGDADSEAIFEHYVSIPEKSRALPGVIHFVNTVHQLGGYVSFVTNRDGTYRDQTGNVLAATVDNLKKAGVYFDQVILANDQANHSPSDKNPRFAAVISGVYDAKLMVWSNKLPPHQVIAWLGDNIQDFPSLKQKSTYQQANNSAVFAKFGQGYFILPNPIYGSWLGNP